MIEIRVNAEEMLACFHQAGLPLKEHLRSLGFTTFEGYVERQDQDVHMTYLFRFFPTKRDLIFKRFDRWTPPWQNRKTILNRRFK